MCPIQELNAATFLCDGIGYQIYCDGCQGSNVAEACSGNPKSAQEIQTAAHGDAQRHLNTHGTRSPEPTAIIIYTL